MVHWWTVEHEHDEEERSQIIARLDRAASTAYRRATVLKRPDERTFHSFEKYLQEPPLLWGRLDKLSKHKRWRARYFELRPPYLMYWVNHHWSRESSWLQLGHRNTVAGQTTKHASVPLGVVDLGKVVNVKRAGKDLQHIQIFMASSTLVELRVPARARIQVKGKESSPPIDEWVQALQTTATKASDLVMEVEAAESMKNSVLANFGEEDQGQELVGESVPGLDPTFAEDESFQHFRAELHAFYSEHAPDKLDRVASLADTFRGREAILFKIIEGKYLPQITGNDDPEDLLLGAGNESTIISSSSQPLNEPYPNEESEGDIELPAKIESYVGNKLSEGNEIVVNPVHDRSNYDHENQNDQLLHNEGEKLLEFPKYLRVCLVLMGIQQGEELFHFPKSWRLENKYSRECSVLFLWVARMIWHGIGFYLIINILAEKFGGESSAVHMRINILKCQQQVDDDATLEVYSYLRNWGHDDQDDGSNDDFLKNEVVKVKYSSSGNEMKWIRYDASSGNEKDLCRLNYIAQLVILPVFGLECLLAFHWILRHAHEEEDIFRTHINRMKSKADKYIKWLIYYTLPSTLMVILMAVPSLNVTYEGVDDRDYDDDSFVSIAYSVSRALAEQLMYSAAAYPVNIVITLFFIEVQRLKACNADFISLMETIPGSFAVLAPAYLELLEEWDHTQKLYEGIGTIIFICTAFIVVSCAVLNVSFYNTGSYFIQEFNDDRWSVVNDFAKVGEATLFAIAAFGTFIVYFSIPYVFFLVAIHRANSYGDTLREQIVLNMIRQGEDDIGGIKLIRLNEEKPCGITLFGRRMNAFDIFISIVSAFTFQLLAIYI